MIIRNILFIIFTLFSFQVLAQEESLSETENNSENYSLSTDKIDPSRFYKKAIIQALNKTTAKTQDLTTRIGEEITFGQLKIIAHKCWQAPLSQKPESKILLEVFEKKKAEGEEVEERIFYGWMFASSPSVSGLEHPIYDIIALGCKNE